MAILAISLGSKGLVSRREWAWLREKGRDCGNTEGPGGQHLGLNLWDLRESKQLWDFQVRRGKMATTPLISRNFNTVEHLSSKALKITKMNNMY